MTTVRITPAIADEYASMEVFPLTEGTHEIPPYVAASLLDDALFYLDPDGPGASLTVGQRRAYAALAAQLSGLSLRSDPEAAQEWIDAQWGPTPEPPPPMEIPSMDVPLSSLSEGDEFTWKGVRWRVEDNTRDPEFPRCRPVNGGASDYIEATVNVFPV